MRCSPKALQVGSPGICPEINWQWSAVVLYYSGYMTIYGVFVSLLKITLVCVLFCVVVYPITMMNGCRWYISL